MTKFTNKKQLEKLGLTKTGIPTTADGSGNGQDGKGKGKMELDDTSTWQDLVDAEFPDAGGEAEKIQDLGNIFKEMFAEQLMEKGEQGIRDLMFILKLATEGLYQDFLAAKFVEYPEVKEEDVYRLRRFVNEAEEKMGAAQ